ncbi:MAG: hypothetical protein M2R45_03242 [Verrucomicrobia subdivision 3 bacterium]|nr:hypothetical protein [Limisphaerales bacterium]MCS1416103.1 hypothetical protein [Limisphaerales bacterium]
MTGLASFYNYRKVDFDLTGLQELRQIAGRFQLCLNTTSKPWV